MQLGSFICNRVLSLLETVDLEELIALADEASRLQSLPHVEFNFHSLQEISSEFFKHWGLATNEHDLDKINFVATTACYWKRKLNFGNCAGVMTFIVEQFDQNHGT